MKKYYAGYITTPIENHLPRVTEKALCFTVAGGYTSINDTYTYIPKSQIIFGEINEVGNQKIYIPVWLMREKRVDIGRLREFGGCCNGEPFIVEI